jgi:acyl-CoA thioester hydrolase
MYSSTFKKRVRYGETDKMGYLYYGHYPQLYEIGRVEMLRELGLPYIKLEDEMKVMLPVLSVEAKYLRPAYYDDLLTIKSILKEMPTKMISIHAEIYNEQEVLLHKALVKLFFIDMESGKRISAPVELTTKLESYFKEA